MMPRQSTTHCPAPHASRVIFKPVTKKINMLQRGSMSAGGAATGRLQRELKGHREFVGSVVFSPSGECVASGSLDRTVRISDAATGQLQRELKGHTWCVNSVAFSPNGERVASGSWDRTVRIWDAHSRFHPTARDASGQLHDLQGRAKRASIRDLVDLAGFDDHMIHKFEQLCLGEKKIGRR